MQTILVGLKNYENLRLLNNFLSQQFTINRIINNSDFSDYFDMIILDKYSLNKYFKEIIEIKKRKRFTPILLLSLETNYKDYSLFNDYVDDILNLPVLKWELQFRINKILKLRVTKESEMKYKKILETSNIGICIIEDDVITSHNGIFLNIFDLKEETIENETFSKIFAFNNGSIIDKLNYFTKLKIESIQFDQNFTINGIERYINIKLSSIAREPLNGSIFMVVLDITENINTIKEIEFLNKHDKLTGLYNRAFLDYYLEEIEKSVNLPISIIMGDIDGLKLINDGFGHKKGDEAIVNVSKIIEQSCRNTDKIFRVGGDEFLVILPNTSEEAAKNVLKRIANLIAYKDKLSYSISLGLTTKLYTDENIEELIIKAENKMYQNKLVNVESHRHSIIKSLEKVLLENTNETHEHAERMKDMVQKMANKLKLDATLAHELDLLARLHDIGKVSIPETILKKSGKLTAKEWEIVKDHPAAGFRITKAIPHLASVSYDILCHHEKWDGSGYPQGLKGEEIPVASRIISIVDAYDVMLHERSYKKAFSKEKAINELITCSGTQFDPKLVKIFLEII